MGILYKECIYIYNLLMKKWVCPRNKKYIYIKACPGNKIDIEAERILLFV